MLRRFILPSRKYAQLPALAVHYLIYTYCFPTIQMNPPLGPIDRAKNKDGISLSYRLCYGFWIPTVASMFK